jgi:hypothetical protein
MPNVAMSGRIRLQAVIGNPHPFLERRKIMAEATPKALAPKKTTAKPAKAAISAKVKKAATKKADPIAVEKALAPRKSAKNKAIAAKKTVSGEQRYRMIAEAAYFRAESRHFKSDPVRDWIEAERDIALLLGENE